MERGGRKQRRRIPDPCGAQEARRHGDQECPGRRLDGGSPQMLTSLRGRLFAGLTAIIVLTGAVGATFAYWWAYNETIEMQDSVLIQIGSFASNASIRQSQPVNGVDAESEVGI